MKCACMQCCNGWWCRNRCTSLLGAWYSGHGDEAAAQAVAVAVARVAHACVRAEVGESRMNKTTTQDITTTRKQQLYM
eukprot:6200205-Pleurochrysis_carterae.AAC.2